MLIPIWVLVGALSATPPMMAMDAEPRPVQLEVDLPNQALKSVDLSGRVVRVEPDEPVVLRLNMFVEGDPSSPLDVEDPTDLLEIREPDGSAVRLADWDEVRPGVYETTYRFDEPGTFVVVLMPDAKDRTSLPEGNMDSVKFDVMTDRTAASGGVSTSAVVASIALVLLVGALVARATRGKAPSHKEPVPHETWWNSP